MSFTLEQIQDMLDALPGDGTGFRFDKVDEDTLTYSGAIRTSQGQNIIEPAAESASMIIGLKSSIDFLTAAPVIVQQLLDVIAQNEAAATSKRALAPQPENVQDEKPAEKPKRESSVNKPISV